MGAAYGQSIQSYTPCPPIIYGQPIISWIGAHARPQDMIWARKFYDMRTRCRDRIWGTTAAGYDMIWARKFYDMIWGTGCARPSYPAKPSHPIISYRSLTSQALPSSPPQDMRGKYCLFLSQNQQDGKASSVFLGNSCLILSFRKQLSEQFLDMIWELFTPITPHISQSTPEFWACGQNSARIRICKREIFEHKNHTRTDEAFSWRVTLINSQKLFTIKSYPNIPMT